MTEEEKQETDDNARTIRPMRSPSGPGMTIPLARSPSTDIGSIVEDYSDLAADEDDEQLLGKVADFRVRPFYSFFYYVHNLPRRRTKTPHKEVSSTRMTSRQSGSLLLVLTPRQYLYLTLDDNLSVHSFNLSIYLVDQSLPAPTPGHLLALDLMADLRPDVCRAKAPSLTNMQKPMMKTTTMCSSPGQVARVSDHSAGYIPCVYSTTAAPPLQLTTRLSSKSWVGIP